MTLISRAVSRFLESRRSHALVAATLFVLPGCAGMGEAMSAHTDVVAQAAGNELRVEEAAQILAGNPQVPADPQVVRAVADLWVDYTLLATAVREDSTLAALDIENFIQPLREQELVNQLRQQVIEVDTIVDDAELERRWATEGPSAEIHARHILLRMPTGGTDAQRDSVRALAESLRERAVGGEPFAELAQQYSQDPGSAARGGDLGFFERGRMVEPFEEAAFQLQPGEISEVVETPFGYHVILVEDRRQPDIGAEREQFRQYLIQTAVNEAERVYLDSLAAEANVEIQEGGLDVVREIANRPDMELSGRAATRSIATYTGGELTAGEFSEFLSGQPAQMQTAFASAPPDQLETGVRQLVQMELLLSEVEERGLTLSPEVEEGIRTQARQDIRTLVESAGFADAARASANAAALDQVVKTIVAQVVAGEAAFVPLGRLGVLLRDLHGAQVNEESFPAVVSRMEELRASMPAPQQAPPEGMLPQIPVDSTGAPIQMPATPPAGAGQ